MAPWPFFALSHFANCYLHRVQHVEDMQIGQLVCACGPQKNHSQFVLSRQNFEAVSQLLTSFSFPDGQVSIANYRTWVDINVDDASSAILFCQS